MCRYHPKTGSSAFQAFLAVEIEFDGKFLSELFAKPVESSILRGIEVNFPV